MESGSGEARGDSRASVDRAPVNSDRRAGAAMSVQHRSMSINMSVQRLTLGVVEGSMCAARKNSEVLKFRGCRVAEIAELVGVLAVPELEQELVEVLAVPELGRESHLLKCYWPCVVGALKEYNDTISTCVRSRVSKQATRIGKLTNS